MSSTFSRDDIRCDVVPRECCRKGCKNMTSSTRVRKTCDWHLAKSNSYRKGPGVREKQKAYMKEYYKSKRSQWSHYEWKQRKLDTILKLQKIPNVKITSISENFENITLILENPQQLQPAPSSPSVLRTLRKPLDNPHSPKHTDRTQSGKL